jgi:hypothetical protein
MANQDRSGIPEEFVPSKQTPIGQEYLNYLAERQGSSKEDERKFKEKEAARAKRDFFQSLIEAGEATRGQKGIGALFGGYGRSSGKFANEADERQSAFEKLRQERSDTDAKLKYEIDNLRRAEARGDAKTVYESKVKIAELTQAKDQMRLTAGQKLAGLESSEGINALDIASREKIAKLVDVLNLLSELGISLTGSNFASAEASNITKAIDFAKTYNADAVYEKHWKPSLEILAQRSVERPSA